MGKYIMEEAQYNALDKALTQSNLCDMFEVQQVDNCDYIYDLELDMRLMLEEGLAQIHECLVDFIDCYDFTDEDIQAYDSLMRQFGVYDESKTCRSM